MKYKLGWKKLSTVNEPVGVEVFSLVVTALIICTIFFMFVEVITK